MNRKPLSMATLSPARQKAIKASAAKLRFPKRNSKPAVSPVQQRMRDDIKRRCKHYRKTGEDIRPSSMTSEDFTAWWNQFYPPEEIAERQRRELERQSGRIDVDHDKYIED